MPEFTEKLFNQEVSMEIKQLVFGIEEYHLRREFDQRCHWDQEEMEELLKRDLISGMMKYITVEEIKYCETRNIVLEAKIHLPYVYDDAIKNKESQIEFITGEFYKADFERSELRNQIYNFNSYPWYKRIWLGYKKRLQVKHEPPT